MAKDYAQLNRLLRSMRSEDEAEIKFYNGFLVMDEHDHPFPVSLTDVREVADLFLDAHYTIAPIALTLHLWSLFKDGDVPLHPSAKLMSFSITVDDTTMQFEATYNTEVGEQSLNYTIQNFDTAQRMDVIRRMSMLDKRLLTSGMRNRWNENYRFSYTQGETQANLQFINLDGPADEQ